MIDYHIHTARCGHGSGTAADYLEKARSLNLHEIGFSEHLPLFHTIDATLAMSWDELPLYTAEVERLKTESEPGPGEVGTRVKLGIEVDYIPRFAEQARAAIEDYDFDFVMGSVHFIDGWGFDDRRYIDNYDAFDLRELYERYFELFVEAACSGLFDVMAHPDLIKKYFRLDDEPLALYERAARALAATGVAIEVSSAGLRKPCRDIYPGQAFLDICFAEGVPVTTGSDAHTPNQLAMGFTAVYQALERAGYTEILSFTGRERAPVALV